MRLLTLFIAALITLPASAQAQQVVSTPNYEWSGPPSLPFVPGNIWTTPPYEFTACRSSSECVPFNMPCAAAGAVNERFLPILEEYKQATRSRFSCGIGKYSALNIPMCVSGHCILGAPTVNPSETMDQRFCTTVADCTVATDKCGHKIAVNTLNYDIRQAQLNDENTGAGCDWTETRPVQRIGCEFRRCTVTMNNYPGQ